MKCKKFKAQSLVEYVMIFTLVFLIAVPAYVTFGDNAKAVYDYLMNKLETGFSSVYK